MSQFTELRDIWAVVAGHPDGLGPADQGAIARAREMADMLGCYARVLMIGAGDGQQAVSLGADSVSVAGVPAGAAPMAIAEGACGALFAEAGPEFVFLAASPFAERLAPALAAVLDAGLAMPCVTLTLDELERVLTVKQPAYDGLFYYPFTFRAGHPQIAVLAPEAQGVPYPDAYRSGEVQTLALEGLAGAPEVVPAEYTPPVVPIKRAQALVAVGRGLGDDAGLALARRLAELLGADLAGDRTARELGWVDENHTVGLTGEVVAPAVYVALGIRSDAEHFYGMADSRFVVALHADGQAPIFRLANLGLVGDVKAGVQTLVEGLGG